jgi:integrase
MTNTTPKYTILRGKVYWLNFKVPTAIYKQSNLTTQIIRLSLNTSEPDKAGSLAQLLTFKLKEYCKAQLPQDVSKAAIDDLIINTMVSLGEVSAQSIQRPSLKVKALTVSSAFVQYDNEMIKAEVWRVKTRCDNQAAIANFVELVGNIPLSSVNPNICRDFKSKLIRYPLHRTKLIEFKGIDVCVLIKSDKTYPTISITTVNNQIRKINSFFNWLVKQGLLTSNPIIGMKIKQKTSLKAARTSFNDSDISSLFSTAIFSEHQFLHDYQYWLPLLALYSGARLEELCQLHIADIKLDSEIPYFNIDDEYHEQHLKNNSSRRAIPIHPELISLGFKVFVNQKQFQGEAKLFGYLVPQRQQLGHKPSQWFSKYKKRCGIADTKKVFHSFRHTMVDSLKKIRAQDYEIKSLLGHQNGSVTHDIYGSIDTPIDSIYSMLQGLSFKELTTKVKAWQ